MGTDHPAPAGFYATPSGAMAARLVSDRLIRLWPAIRGLGVLGIGHAGPYLEPWRADAARCVAVASPVLGVSAWPAGARGLTCAAADILPFADLSFDRVLLVHGLEAAESDARLLREVWRVLRDDGRLLVVAANRRGMWAHMDSTPFGQGRPYSTGQVGRLLGASLFRVEQRDTALYPPPSAHRLVLNAAPLIERAGRGVAPGLAGVTITEAVKHCWAALPLTAPSRRLVLAQAA